MKIIWTKIRDTGAQGECAPIEWFMAKMLLHSQKFHTEMKSLLQPFGDYNAATMKGYNRIKAKCSPRAAGDYSVQQLKKEGRDARQPTIRHVKDCLVGPFRIVKFVC